MDYYVIPPAGLVPAGLWTPPELAPPIVAAGSLADDIDPATGELVRLVGKKHPIDAHVENVCRLVAKKSQVYEKRGLDLSSIPKAMITNGNAIEFELRAMLADLVTARKISIERIYTGTTQEQLGPGTADMNAAVLVYANLITGARDQRAKVAKQ